LNTLQSAYQIAWWRHYCITSRVTERYFTELLLRIKYALFWR